MLDDLKYIHSKDKSDALGVANAQWQQLVQRFEVSWAASNVENVVVAGMGGSALAASFVTSWPKVRVPFEVVRGYDIPQYVSEKTLFIASSYSGNTEETLSTLKQAEVAKAQIVVISAGGALADIADKKDYPFYRLSSDFQPRMAVFYNFAALIQLLVDAQLVDASVIDELKKASKFVADESKNWSADIATTNNQAKQIALEMVGKSPVIYGGVLAPATYKWKINFNENSKNIAWCNQFPEFNHNEFLGWTSHPVDKPYAPVFLQSSFDNQQVTKRFEISARLLSGKMPTPLIIESKGSTFLEQLLYVVTLGDFVSLYTAILNNLDPTPVELIEKLKVELAK